VVFRYALTDAGTRTGELVSGIEEFRMGAGDDIVDLTSKTLGSSATDESVTLFGEAGRDSLWTGAANDTLVGGNDGDWLSGGAGNDTLYGGNLPADGADTNAAGSGWTITGLTGTFNDVLDGGAGNDTIVGGVGNDLVSGGIGNDTLTGGAGADSFLFRFNSTPAGWGSDTILDFNYGQGDRLVALDWDKTLVTAAEDGAGNLVLNYLGAGEITLQGIDFADLTTIGVTVQDLFGGP